MQVTKGEEESSQAPCFPLERCQPSVCRRGCPTTPADVLPSSALMWLPAMLQHDQRSRQQREAGRKPGGARCSKTKSAEGSVRVHQVRLCTCQEAGKVQGVRRLVKPGGAPGTVLKVKWRTRGCWPLG